MLTDDALDNINMWLYLKDKFNISDVARREITMKANAVPKTYGIKKRIRKLNSKWNLKAVPGDFEGVQVGFEESLKKHVSRLQQTGVPADSVRRRKCPPGHYPLADTVSPDTIRNADSVPHRGFCPPKRNTGISFSSRVLWSKYRTLD